MLGTILIILLILLLIGALPRWGYSRGWGYGPSGILGIILVVIFILLLMGRLSRSRLHRPGEKLTGGWIHPRTFSTRPSQASDS